MGPPSVSTPFAMTCYAPLCIYLVALLGFIHLSLDILYYIYDRVRVGLLEVTALVRQYPIYMCCVGIWDVGIEKSKGFLFPKSLVQAAKGQKFFLHILRDTMSALAPESAFLDTPKGDARAGDASGVDSDHTNLQCLSDPPDPTDVS